MLEDQEVDLSPKALEALAALICIVPEDGWFKEERFCAKAYLHVAHSIFEELARAGCIAIADCGVWKRMSYSNWRTSSFPGR